MARSTWANILYTRKFLPISLDIQGGKNETGEKFVGWKCNPLVYWTGVNQVTAAAKVLNEVIVQVMALLHYMYMTLLLWYSGVLPDRAGPLSSSLSCIIFSIQGCAQK